MLLHSPGVRTVDQLIDNVWPKRAPATARASLQNLVSSLRQTIGSELVATSHAGYALVLDEDQVDAWRFERLLAQSRTQEPAEKIVTLESALGLWRGSPLVDVRYEDFAQIEIRRLEELRVCAYEELFAVKLELGDEAMLVPELQRLVDSFPYRERLRMQLVVALHRSGRAIEASAMHSDWRRIVAESLGNEASRVLEAAQQEIVRTKGGHREQVLRLSTRRSGSPSRGFESARGSRVARTRRP